MLKIFFEQPLPFPRKGSIFLQICFWIVITRLFHEQLKGQCHIAWFWYGQTLLNNLSSHILFIFSLKFTMCKFLVQCWNTQGPCSPESRLTLKLILFTKKWSLIDSVSKILSLPLNSCVLEISNINDIVLFKMCRLSVCVCIISLLS